jgi:hypothetical protein
MWRERFKDWRGTFAAAATLVIVTSLTAILAAPRFDDADLRKALYTGAVTLFFVGLLGGMLKILLDDVATVKRKREDAAAFVTNVLKDLKDVYDRVARARVLIPAHKSVKTYGDEMRNLIEARVQLRNVTRALERPAEGIIDDTREKITRLVGQMETYLETLTCEFRDNYKPLSDKQRSYEERTKVVLKDFAEKDGDVIPTLPGFVWDSIAHLERLSDFIGEANEYKAHFETPLDDASETLRKELACIIGGKSPRSTSAAVSQRN